MAHVDMAKHLWRALRGILALMAAYFWLYTDYVHTVFILLILVAIVDQFKGTFVYLISKVMHWTDVNINPWG